MDIFITSHEKSFIIVFSANNLTINKTLLHQNCMENIDSVFIEGFKEINQNAEHITNIFLNIGPSNLTALKIILSFINGLMFNKQILLHTFSTFDLFNASNEDLILIKANNLTYYFKHNNELGILKLEEVANLKNIKSIFTNDKSILPNLNFKITYVSIAEIDLNIIKKIATKIKPNETIEPVYIKPAL
jgi:tRNA A37 threonylcarbamoyladenosine modification protein TsaB